MKALKMREVRRKLEIIGRQAGLKGKGKGKREDDEEDGVIDEALRELDLEGDWNPEKHDQQMAGLFDRDADAFEDDGAGRDEDGLKFDDDGKPVWDDDIDIGDIALPGNDVDAKPSRKEEKKKKKKKKKKDEGNDDNAVDVDAMDADVEPAFQDDEDDEEWDGTEEMRKRVLKKYMDQLDGLDFNDMVGSFSVFLWNLF